MIRAIFRGNCVFVYSRLERRCDFQQSRSSSYVSHRVGEQPHLSLWFPPDTFCEHMGVTHRISKHILECITVVMHSTHCNEKHKTLGDGFFSRVHIYLSHCQSHNEYFLYNYKRGAFKFQDSHDGVIDRWGLEKILSHWITHIHFFHIQCHRI